VIASGIARAEGPAWSGASEVAISCKIVKWRATVDEDGHYAFSVAL
jgi:hypothetical protein